MDRIDVSEYFAGKDAGNQAEPTVADEQEPKQEPVNFTYNGFFGFPISDWIVAHLLKKTPAGR